MDAGRRGQSKRAVASASSDAVAAPNYIRALDDVGIGDIALVGGKNAALGEMQQRLRTAGVATPEGFAIVADAYRDALTAGGAWPKLHALLDNLDVGDVAELSRRAAAARALVYAAVDYAPVIAQIRRAYAELTLRCGDVGLAVRSSATAEDLPTASFAGQHESFLNVRGEAGLIEACRRCFASLFTDRAIVYRAEGGFDHFRVALSVGVMRMVRSDLAASGVIFTLDTETGFRDVVLITGGYGLGEMVVQGRIDPDELYVHKPTFRGGYRAVLRRRLGRKQAKLALGRAGRPIERAVSRSARAGFCITDAEALRLTEMALRIEDHFSERHGAPTPMDIEWAKDGVDGGLYIVQARPETAASRRTAGAIETYRLSGTGQTVLTGRAVGEKIASGVVRLIRDKADLAAFRPGDVLVAEMTSPDWEEVMKGAAALVTDRGGRTCHAAILARELGVPALVGAGEATRRLATGQTVTVTCAEGDTGRVLAGEVPFVVETAPPRELARTRTKAMVNLANPDLAFRTGMLPVAGVGLARMEFIISQHVRAHPMALAHPERLGPRDRAIVARLTRGYDSPAAFFIERVAEGVGTIAAAFYPRPAIVRLSDFKTNEYASLLGGKAFEPREANPMLGFRGAARYAHPAYADGFALECQALARVRGAMGLTNLRIMVPFCRRVEEGRRVLEAMAAHGLRQGDDGLEVFVMCEIPNNVVQIDAFCELFDGVSIGSNDLTQLVLGVDRDSEIVAFDFDERDPGVMEMLRQAIAGAKRRRRHVGICGEAPATYPEIARFLVEQGIDSISVNPASAPALMRLIAEAESRQPRADEVPVRA
ncbi:MAG TPA: phosphoenolpyruvate synthase [Caulobacteraceae bacterium]|nr:phosphoenolpyruvate synthase [Caulobacteraceae bacterium]